MHTTTLSEIRTLESLIAAKKDRIAAIERLVAGYRANYKKMTDSELVHTIREIRELEQELSREKSWCVKQEAKIKSFYRPAAMVA